jgi:hypothetical protein
VPPSKAQLSVLIDEWVAHGIITPEQADRMLESQSQQPSGPGRPVPPARSSLAVEALGYLGGVIVVVATMLIAAQYWADITTAWRMVIVGGAAAGLLAGGFAVPGRLGDAGSRLRATLWFAATVALAGFLAVLATDALTLEGADAMLLVAAGTTASAAVLWVLHRGLLQQVAMMVGSMLVAAAAIADLVSNDALPGVGVWGVAVIWSLLGWGGLLRPPPAAMALGAVGAVVGAMTTMPYDAGIVFALSTSAAIVVVAVLFHDLLLLGIGGLGALLVLPNALTEWFPDSRAAPFALLALGGLLVVAALWTARRRVRHPETAQVSRDYSVGQPDIALRAAAAVVVLVVGLVLTIALT